MLIVCSVATSLAGPQSVEPAHKPLAGDVALPTGAVARLGVHLGTKGGGGVLAASPDGRLLAVEGFIPEGPAKQAGAPAPGRGIIHLLEMPGGRLLNTLPGPTGGVRQLAFSADGHLLAASGAGELLVADTVTGKQVWRTALAGMAAEVLRFTADGKTLITGGRGSAAASWDVATGRQLRQWRPQVLKQGPQHACQYVELSGNGQVLVCRVGTGANQTLQLFHAETGKLLLDYDAWTPDRALAVSPDGSVIASGRSWITLLDGRDGRPLPTVEHVPGPVDALFFTPDSRRLFSVHGDLRKVVAWDLATRRKLYEIPWARAAPYSASRTLLLAFAPDSKAFWSIENGRLLRWDGQTGERLLAHAGHYLPVQHVAFTLDGRTLISACTQKRCLWDPRTWKDTGSAFIGHQLEREGVLGFGWRSGLLVVKTRTGDLQLKDVTTGQMVRKLEGKDASFLLASFAADESTIALIGRDGDQKLLRLYETASGKVLGQRLASEHLLPDGAFLIGRHVVGMDRDGVLLLDIRTGRVVRRFALGPFRLAEGQTSIARFDVSADGKCLVASLQCVAQNGDLRDRIFLWELDTGLDVGRREITADAAPSVAVVALAVTPDHRKLALGTGSEGTIRVLETASGTEWGRLTGHEGTVRSLSFSSDSKLLASGGDDNTVLVWDLDRPPDAMPPPQADLSMARLLDCWKMLGQRERRQAEPALWTLLRAPGPAIRFLKERLKPVTTSATPETIRQWINNLNNRQFPVREQATMQLQRAGELAIPEMAKALDETAAVEVKMRLADLLRTATSLDHSDYLRQVRALEVLERIGNPEARELLHTLARGASGARLTREARACLKRLER
jgi:WD40 repeat protein